MPTFFGPAGSGSESFDEFLARYLQGQRAAQSGRTIDITRLLSRRTQEVLADAARFAVEHGHSEVDALHVLPSELRWIRRLLVLDDRLLENGAGHLRYHPLRRGRVAGPDRPIRDLRRRFRRSAED